MTDAPDDPYASPPPGWQPPSAAPAPPYGAPPAPPPPPPPPYGAPPPPAPPYGAPPAPPPPPYGAPPQPYAAHYGAPYAQYPPGYYPPPSTTNGYAIAALICSIVGWVVLGIGSVLGVIFGIIGIRHCRQNNERGRGLAIAGIIIGGLGIVFWLLVVLGLAINASSSSGSTVNHLGTLGTVQVTAG